MFIRSHYNYDVEAVSNETAYVETMPSLTVQSMSEDADLNIMLKRFGVTGKMPENVRLPQYGDFSHITDFRSAMDAVLEAQDNFMTLPADVRAKFENNPQLMLDFVENPANIEQVKKLFGEKNVESRSSGEQSPLRAEPNRSVPEANNEVGKASAAGAGGAGGSPASRE